MLDYPMKQRLIGQPNKPHGEQTWESTSDDQDPKLQSPIPHETQTQPPHRLDPKRPRPDPRPRLTKTPLGFMD